LKRSLSSAIGGAGDVASLPNAPPALSQRQSTEAIRAIDAEAKPHKRLRRDSPSPSFKPELGVGDKQSKQSVPGRGGQPPEGGQVEAKRSRGVSSTAGAAIVVADKPARARAPKGLLHAGATVQTSDSVVGAGPPLQSGDKGYIYVDGTVFGQRIAFLNTRGDPSPLQITVGESNFPAGFQRGLIGMQAGGHRTIILPPEAAYGDRGNERLNIPPGAILVFAVHLVTIHNAQGSTSG
ncbi:hypothetical protein EVJ58_g11034, partial [Rhodofomes roseus]